MSSKERLVTEHFIEEMNGKLEENAHKPHWSMETLSVLLEGLEAEVQELREALSLYLQDNSEISADEVMKEAADVGNFAMFLHDILHHAHVKKHIVESSEEEGLVIISYSNWRGEQREYQIKPIRVYSGLTAHHETLSESRLFLQAIKYPSKQERDFLIRDILEVEGESMGHYSDFDVAKTIFSVFAEKQRFKDERKG